MVIGLDVIAGDSGGLPETGGVYPESDYAVVLDGDTGHMMVRASNDPYGIEYAWLRDYEPVDPADFQEGSGVWNVQRLVVNRPLVIPSSGEALPAEAIAPGEMVSGTTDVDDEAFNRESTWTARGKVIELRLPYQAIGFSDASSLQAYRIGQDGSISSDTVDRVEITIVVGDAVFTTAGYAWEPWQRPVWNERIKDGEVFAEAVIAANTP